MVCSLPPTTTTACAGADGYLFDVITNGKGLMLGLKDRLTLKNAGQSSFMFVHSSSRKMRAQTHSLTRNALS